MAKDVQNIQPVRRSYHVSRGPVKCESGLGTPYVATAIFDTAGTDSSGAANTTVAAHGLGVYIPDNAVITRAWYDVVTTFQSTAGGADKATIALSVQAAEDIVAAIAIEDGTNVWDAGIRGSKIGFPNLGADAAHDSAVEVAALYPGTYLKMTAERQLTATVAVAALTAGKLVLFVEYVISA
jgi:hypothetical protein